MVQRETYSEEHADLTGPYKYLLHHPSNRDKIVDGALKFSPAYQQGNTPGSPRPSNTEKIIRLVHPEFFPPKVPQRTKIK